MYQTTLRTLLCIVLAAQLSVGVAATPAIGVATATGNVQLDGARVLSNGTLFDGTTVVTGESSSRLQLNDGVQMELASSSRGTVYRDHLVLERGAGQLESARDYRIEVMGLSIASSQPESSARVRVNNNQVQVASLRGNLRVMDSQGLVLAAVPAGQALAFSAAEGGASAPSSVAGCLAVDNGHYLLADETANITVELRGKELDGMEGRHVTATGVIVPSAQPVKGADRVLQVSSMVVRTESRACKAASGAAAAAAGGAAGAAAGAAAAGAGATAGGIATTAVIAGVVVAGAGTAAAVGLTRGSEQDTVISR